MNGRVLSLGLAVLLLAAAIYLVARDDDPATAPPLVTPEIAPPTVAPPSLTATGTAPESANAPAVFDSEDAWLRAWKPAEGIPMGDDTLDGVVVDPAGKPIWDARVYLRTKPGQPAVIDEPTSWHARTDRDGKWQIEHAWGERVIVCAWAPGYERAHLAQIDPDVEIRLTLAPAAPLMVTLQSPPRDERLEVHELIDDARIRVRLVAEGASEHPRPEDPLGVAWDHLIELDTPTPVRIPRDVSAHLTADAPEYASDPAFVTLPVAAKEVVLQLVPSARIVVRLLDAATKKPLEIHGDGWGFTELTNAASGFEIESAWVENTVSHGRGIAPGTYHLRARYEGRLDPPDLEPIVVAKRGEVVRVDVPLARDLTHGTLHVVLKHAAGSQLAGHPVEGGGLTLVRRREDKPAPWRHAGGMTFRLSDGREKRTLEDLPVGTYDILVWGGSNLPSVGHVLARKVEGGTETTIDVALEEGYGFRPGDALEGDLGTLRHLRAESKLLGALPWITWGGASALHAADARGFAQVSGTGYIASYPSGEITIVELLESGRARKKKVKASISPPR